MCAGTRGPRSTLRCACVPACLRPQLTSYCAPAMGGTSTLSTSRPSVGRSGNGAEIVAVSTASALQGEVAGEGAHAKT